MFYVYAWYNVKTKEIFYVGKGTGNRYKQIRDRNKLFIKYYDNNVCCVKIMKYFEHEEDAFEYEHKHITRLKKIGQCCCNLDNGGVGGVSFVWTDEMRAYQSKYNPMKDEFQRKRMSKQNPMKQKDVSVIVASKKKRPVVINGKYFDGVSDAAEFYNKYPQQIALWCKRGYDGNRNPCRYFDEKQKEFNMKVTSSRKVIIDGKTYNSIRDAARCFDTYPETIIRAIKQGRKFKGHDCKYGNQ